MKHVYWLSIFSLIILIFTFLPNLYTYYYADDFAYLSLLKNQSCFNFLINYYLTWEGRSLSLPVIIQSHLFKFVNIKFLTFVTQFYIFGSAYFGFCILENHFNLKFRNKFIRFNYIVFFYIALWLSISPILPEIVYWASGSYYAASLFLLSIWLYCYECKIYLKGKICKILFLFFCIICGGMQHHLTLALYIYILFDVFNIAYFNKMYNSIHFKILTFLTIGYSMILFSPGSLNRAKAYGYSTSLSSYISIQYFTNTMYNITMHYWFIIKTLILLFAFLSLFLIAIEKYTTKNKFVFSGGSFTIENLINLLYKVKYLIVALCSTLFFYFVPNSLVGRADVFFIYFIFIFLVQTIIPLYTRISKYKRIHFVFSFILIFCVYFYTFNFLLNNLYLGKKIHEDQKYILTTINNSEGKDVVLEQPTVYNNCTLYPQINFHLTKEINGAIINGMAQINNLKDFNYSGEPNRSDLKFSIFESLQSVFRKENKLLQESKLKN